MLDDIKFYLWIGVIAVLSAIYRFKNMWQFIRDGILGFIIGTISIMILSYFDLPEIVKGGLGGAFTLWSKQIYDLIIALFEKAKENPEILFKRKK